MTDDQSVKGVRRSPGRPKVPLDRILDTALAITDEEGVEALSMRTLAQRLGSGTATLYRHFDSRSTLAAHVVDRVFGEVDLDAEQMAAMGWQAALRTIAHSIFDALGRHRNVASLLVEHVPLGPNAMALRERGLAVLLDGGFPPEMAARSYTALAGHVLGFAMQYGARGGAGRDADEQVSAVFHAIDQDSYPATVAAADFMPVPLSEEFSLALELLLDGLNQLRARVATA